MGRQGGSATQGPLPRHRHGDGAPRPEARPDAVLQDVADELDVTVEEVREAMAIGASYRPASLDRPTDGELSLTDVKDFEPAGTPDHQTRPVPRMHKLPERERQIVYLRYFADPTEQEIADVMGMSQVHVSRLLRTALQRLRHDVVLECRSSVDGLGPRSRTTSTVKPRALSPHLAPIPAPAAAAGARSPQPHVHGPAGTVRPTPARQAGRPGDAWGVMLDSTVERG